MWHQWFNRNFVKLREYFLCAKKTKITTIQQFVSASPYSAILEYHDVKSVNNVNISAWCCWHRTAYVVYVQIKARAYIVILSKMALQGDAEETNCWIVVIFVFFAHKKYSLSFTKLRLNHWCHMDNLKMSLLHFCAWIVVIPLLSMGGSESSRNASKIS